MWLCFFQHNFQAGPGRNSLPGNIRKHVRNEDAGERGEDSQRWLYTKSFKAGESV